MTVVETKEAPMYLLYDGGWCAGAGAGAFFFCCECKKLQHATSSETYFLERVATGLCRDGRTRRLGYHDITGVEWDN